MYYVVAVSRNYNLVISIRAGAPGGQSAAFATRLETCRGPIETINCNITIDFQWSTAGAGSGTGQVTIFSGTSGNSTIPAPGNALTYIGITNISSDCTNYNNIQACPPFDSATTTTTTSTTTSTTTIAPVQYSSAAIKHDQFSGSFNFGTNIWPNLGVSGSRYDFRKDPSISTNLNAGGSGTAVFLGATSSLQNGYYLNCIELKQQPFINLTNISFSYAVLFRIVNPNYNVSKYFSIASFSNTGPFFSGFNLYATINNDNTTMKLSTSLYKQSVSKTPSITLTAVNKWYLCVITFDKNQDSNNCANFYVNGGKIEGLFSGAYDIPNPSTFFQTTGQGGSFFSSATLNPLQIAASIFWQNTVLSQGEIQNLTNEYNSRYTLG
jgi:hypothetical protein